MAPPEKRRSNQPIFWAAGIVLVIAAVFAIRAMTREVVKVNVAQVSYQTLSSSVPTNGKVEPVEPFQAHATTPGVLEKIYVSEGDHVVPGQLLLRMDDADIRARLATAQASLSQAELQLSDIEHGGSSEERGNFSSNTNSAKLEQESAAQNLASLETLQQKGAASASEVTAAKQRLNSAEVALGNANTHSAQRYGSSDKANAQARVAEARAAVNAANAALAAADIRSPYEGTVYYIPYSQYEFVPAGEDMMDIADLNKLLVRAYFDEPDIGRLKDGQPVTITWDAKPGKVWHGHMSHAPNTVITYGGTRNVGEGIISVDDARGDLTPNSNVLVRVTEEQRSNVLSIPREALHTDGSKNYVYKIVDGKLQQTPIQIGSLVTNTNVEIVGGLRPNDTVVLGPATAGTELFNGLAVKPVKPAKPVK